VKEDSASTMDLDTFVARLLEWNTLAQEREQPSDVSEELSVVAVDKIRELVAALEHEWTIYHSQRCTNMEDCSTFTSLGSRCEHPRPRILQEGLALLTAE